MKPILHNFFRSSASIRVRAALNLKGISYDQVSYVLRENEHHSEAFLALNPQGLVPALQLDSQTVIAQSLAIIDYLDEVYPEPAFLPKTPLDRAWVRSLAYSLACDVHPINNLRVLGYIGTELGADDAQVKAWFQHWVAEAFGPVEAMLSKDARRGQFCYGDTPGYADLSLFAQVTNNRRFEVDMSPYPTIQAIHQACLALPAFVDVLPENHPHAS